LSCRWRDLIFTPTRTPFYGSEAYCEESGDGLGGAKWWASRSIGYGTSGLFEDAAIGGGAWRLFSLAI